MTAELFEKCLDNVDPDQRFEYNQPIITGFGETLLHPDYDQLFGIAKRKGIFLRMHSNGLLMEKEDVEKLINNNVKRLEISIHTEKSLAGFKLAYELIAKQHPEIVLRANIMSCYTGQLQGWINNVGLPEEALHRITIINMHNWARNEREFTSEENLIWQNKCAFLLSGAAVIRWDGNVYTCCVDSEGVNYVGHVDNFPTLKLKPETYKLCAKCSPAWFNGEVGGVKLPIFSK